VGRWKLPELAGRVRGGAGGIVHKLGVWKRATEQISLRNEKALWKGDSGLSLRFVGGRIRNGAGKKVRKS